MITKTMMVSLFALSLLALTGIGYAAFTSTVTANITATGGTLTLEWNTPAVDVSSASYANCGYTYGVSTTTFTVSAIAPGDAGCWYDLSVYNAGNVPATTLIPGGGGAFGGSDAGDYGLACFYAAFVSAPAGPLNPSTSSGTFYLHVYIPSGHTDACQGFTASTTATLEGTVGS